MMNHLSGKQCLCKLDMHAVDNSLSQALHTVSPCASRNMPGRASCNRKVTGPGQHSALQTQAAGPKGCEAIWYSGCKLRTLHPRHSLNSGSTMSASFQVCRIKLLRPVLVCNARARASLSRRPPSRHAHPLYLALFQLQEYSVACMPACNKPVVI